MNECKTSNDAGVPRLNDTSVGSYKILFRRCCFDLYLVKKKKLGREESYDKERKKANEVDLESNIVLSFVGNFEITVALFLKFN